MLHPLRKPGENIFCMRRESMKKLAVFALAALLVSVSCTLEETIDEITSQGNTYTVSFVLHGGTIAGSTEYGPVKVQHSHTIMSGVVMRS